MESEHPSDLKATSRSKVRLAGSLAFLGGALLLGGCANSYSVKVDAIAKPKAEEAISYKIVNRNPAVSDDSLRYKEAAGFVRTALSGKGMYEAPDPEKADLVVSLDYGLGPPKSKQEPVSEPVYMTFPGQMRTERQQVGTDKNGNPVYRTVTVQDPPTTELVGYREYMITVTTYEKYLRMNAMENKPSTEGRAPSEVWTVDVTSEGESRDVRKSLPVLAAASIDWIGKETKGQKTIRIKDEDVAFVRKGM